MVLPLQQTDVGPAVAYRIDADDRIIDVNEAWISFAERNGGDGLRPELVIGHVLWDFLTDSTTVHLYHGICKQLRSGGPTVQFRFRCDAPDVRRLLAMKMVCGDAGSIEFTVTPVAEQPRVTLPLVGVSSSNPGPLVSMCGWCKRVRAPDATWVEIERGIEALGLFQSTTPLPAVSHGICDACELAMSVDLDSLTVTLGPLPDASRLR